MERIARRFLMWSVICGVSAAPSLFVGAGIHPGGAALSAMLLGILIFVLAYTVLSGTRLVARVRTWPHAERTLKIGYGTRLLISIVFPIGLSVDMFCGMLSMAMVGTSTRTVETFGAILLTTLVQGIVLNVLLAVYMTIVWSLQRVLLPRPVREGEGLCLRCGYDLRASAGVCPECGQRITAQAA